MTEHNYRNFPDAEAAKAAVTVEGNPIYGIVHGLRYLFTLEGGIVPQGEALEESVPPKPKTGLAAHFHVEEFHNFGDDMKLAWKLRAIATGPTCLKGAERFNRDIAPNWYYVHEITLPETNTREAKDCWRTVIIEKNFTAYEFVSDGVAADVARLAEQFPGEWDGQVPKHKVVEQSTSSGQKVLKFVPQFTK